MKQSIIKVFLIGLNKLGHRQACLHCNINYDDFDVFCSSNFFSDNENYQMLLNQEQGCYLYTNNGINNSSFSQNFKSFLGDRIVDELEIMSDVFNNKPIKILIIKVNENDFRLIFEMHSADRLRIL